LGYLESHAKKRRFMADPLPWHEYYRDILGSPSKSNYNTISLKNKL